MEKGALPEVTAPQRKVDERIWDCVVTEPQSSIYLHPDAPASSSLPSPPSTPSWISRNRREKRGMTAGRELSLSCTTLQPSYQNVLIHNQSQVLPHFSKMLNPISCQRASI
ncbi:hypothetical protein JOB18_018500 [Solea senegalensis]|uniref:Uncharacterized protein n=1 Tax=Solea senegalensis TaxID=28829 RepID=A0AAV6QLQ4_SOLSE|nr:hypothetical protein JOB18_018500 [Solea senegalensis]